MIQPSATFQPDVDLASYQLEDAPVYRVAPREDYPWIGWVIIAAVVFWGGFALWLFS